jgi:hypothetical protein
MKANHFAVSFINDPRNPMPLMLVFSEDAQKQVCISMTREFGERLLQVLSQTLKEKTP